MLKTLILFILSVSYITSAISEEYLPENLIQMDPYFTHHVIVAEKSTHQLYIYQNNSGTPQLIKTFPMATGKKAGDKLTQGDFRTPEGIFEFSKFLPHKALIQRHGDAGKIYGVGAFVMNYPNPMDARQNKSGGGIWLHSTNDETRIEKGLDSRGCVVTGNKDLIDISKYLEIGKSHIVVVDSLKYLSQKAHQLQREKVNSFLNNWVQAWKSENITTYLSHYHLRDFKTPSGTEFNEFANYKERVFKSPGKPEIEISDVAILQSEDYLKVIFKQTYRSKTINDTGKKTIYLTQDSHYSYKIVEERWNRIEKEQREVSSFEPSMRFFDSEVVDKNIFLKASNN